MRSIQSIAAQAGREARANGLPCDPNGGTYRTRTEDEQAQYESDQAWWARQSIIKCYGSLDNWFRIQRRQHGVHDHPVKPKEQTK
jgi:hypothetical protein